MDRYRRHGRLITGDREGEERSGIFAMCFIGVVQLTSFRGIYKYMVIYIAVQIEPLILLIHFFRSSKVKKNAFSLY